ncbi:hypothetical protein GN958_ATG15363 [Phytophthora infestans]|uniref:Uncharacterized protein n=1 Tax=Phytophthora infestans TaxID=4787 RepID=A0A8S9U3C6_PHYIN|nr:hypothetical protein GN958_ATG15363 [Phytophthora infestans]
MLFLLKEAGTRPDPMAAKDLFDLDLETIQNTQSELFEMLSVLVGESQTQIKTEAKPAAGLLRHLSRGHGPDPGTVGRGAAAVSTETCGKGGRRGGVANAGRPTLGKSKQTADAF